MIRNKILWLYKILIVWTWLRRGIVNLKLILFKNWRMSKSDIKLWNLESDYNIDL